MKIEIKSTTKVYSNYKRHHHDMLSIAMIKNGKIEIEFDNEEILLSPNQLIVFNPYDNHKTIVIDKDTTDYKVIYFDLDWCEEIQKVEIFNPIATTIIEDKNLVDRFVKLKSSKDIDVVEKFLSDIFKRYCNRVINQKTRSDFLKSVVDYIEVSDELSLDEISKYFNISKNHLIRVFKDEFGLSVHAYIVNKKVHLAKSLLLKGGSIAEVSVESGFYDQSHFHKVFKSVFGMTPKEFQKR